MGLKPTTVFIFLLSLAACGYPHTREEIEAAMQHYDRLIKKMDADSIARLYTADGDLGSIAHGRDSIRRFLSSFKNVRVLEVTSTTDSLKIDHNSAFQAGSYTQSGVMNEKDSFHVKGIYHAQWTWDEKEGWLIKKMITQPQ